MTDDWSAVTTKEFVLYATDLHLNASSVAVDLSEVAELRVVVTSCDGDGALSFGRC